MIQSQMATQNRATVVLLHGFTLTGRSWDAVRAALPPDVVAVTPDIRGHGSRADAVPVDLAGVLADLGSLVPVGATLAGYSMGGRLALHAALDPALGPRLARLVLIGASPGLADADERSVRRAADERLADTIETLSIEQVAERWARTPVLADQPDAVQAAARADRLRGSPGGLAAALRGLGTGALPSLWERLGELSMPVTLIVGERDVRFSATARAMAARIPACEVLAVPGAGHAVQLERPAEVARTLAARTP
jgi:2-succinyl-6-hydroxy-2,4-cyclohexadiene-1-carboxylate synthase